MLELGFLGEELNLTMVQGADFGPVLVTTTSPDDTPVDFTGCTFRGQIRSKFGKHLANITVTMDNPGDGEYSFGVPASVTAKLPAGADLDSEDSVHRWDLECVDSSGLIVPVYYGTVTVRKRITKVTAVPPPPPLPPHGT